MSELKKFKFEFGGKTHTVKEDAQQAFSIPAEGVSPLGGPTHWRIFDSLGTEIPVDFHSDDDEAEIVAQAKEELKKYSETTTLDQGS